MYILKKKGQGTLWPSSGLDTAPYPQEKHIIQNNTDQVWDYHLGFGIGDLIKYRYLHSLEFASSLGKILWVILCAHYPG